MTQSQWSEELRGGGVLHAIEGKCAAPVWCGNGRYVVLPAGRSLRLYIFRRTDEISDEVKLLSRVKTLSGHTKEISAVADLGRYRCVSVSKDGTARVWDISDGVVIRTVDLGFPVTALATHEGLRNRAYVAVGNQIRRIEIMRGRSEAEVMLDCSLLSMSPKHEVLIAVRRKSVYLFSGNVAFENRSFVKFRHMRNITAIAAHPEDGSIAVGDKKGVITIYHNVLKQCEGHIHGRKTLKSTSITQSKMHWHADAVLSLSYTSEGMDLLSGGSEAVLVLWELSTGKKRFLPRLGGAIQAIAPKPSGTAYAVTCADNAVRFISTASFSVVAQVRGVRPVDAFRSHSKPKQRISLLPDLREPGVAMVVGLPTSMQIYNLWADEHIADIFVSPRNEIFGFKSRSDTNSAGTARVERACLSFDGSYLITLDILAGDSAKKEAMLKIETLRFSRMQRGNFAAVAKKQNPHGTGSVTTMAYHPTKHVVATGSTAGDIRIWEEQSEDNSWHCADILGYKGFVCSSIGFSPDGSVLVAACGMALVIWYLDSRGIPKGNLSLRVLCHASGEETLTTVGVPGSKDCPLLITASSRSLHVWNVISSSIWWSVRLPTTGIAVDPMGSTFAVSFRMSNMSDEKTNSLQQGIAIFDIWKPTPLRVFRLDSDIMSMNFIPTTDGSQSALVVLNSRMEIISYGNKTDIESARTAAEMSEMTEDDVEQEPTTRMKPEINSDEPTSDAAQAVNEDVDIIMLEKTARQSLAAFDAPAHVLPPLTVTAPKYFEELSSAFKFASEESDNLDVNHEADGTVLQSKKVAANPKKKAPSKSNKAQKQIRNDLLSESMLTRISEVFALND